MLGNGKLLNMLIIYHEDNLPELQHLFAKVVCFEEGCWVNAAVKGTLCDCI